MQNERLVEYTAVYKPKHERGSAVFKGCYLCGAKRDLTKDHVTARTMFAPYALVHPIVLRACRLCNYKRSLDDEYVLRSIQATSFNPQAQECFKTSLDKARTKQSIYDPLNTQPGWKLYANMLDSISQVDIATKGGIVVDRAPALHLSPETEERHNRYVINIAKGLASHNLDSLLKWDKYESRILQSQALQDMGIMDDDKFREIWEHGQYGETWRHFFSYRGAVTSDGSAQIWVMTFYSSHLAAVGFFKHNSVKRLKAGTLSFTND